MPQPKPRPKKLNAGKRRFQHSKLSSQELFELTAAHRNSTEPPQRQSSDTHYLRLAASLFAASFLQAPQIYVHTCPSYHLSY